MMAQHRIGVDLGGTKIEAIVLDFDARGERPNVLARARVPTDRDKGYEHIVAATSDLVAQVARDAGIDPKRTPMGVGMPGSVTMRRGDGSQSDVPLVKNSNTTCLNGRPFRRELSHAIGTDVAFANDANCFALAEAMWGAARGARVTFGVIVGTGVGGGLVLTGPNGVPHAWDGAQSIAGEWGHVVLDPVHGAACYCGQRGCIETYLCGPAIEAAYASRRGQGRSLVDIAAGAASGDDPIARDLLDERFELFGRALSTVVNIVDPDVIVVGGGVSNVDALYDKGVSAVRRWIFNDDLQTKIVKNVLGDSAGVLGAALLPVAS